MFKVLLVDDDEVSLDTLERLLRLDGYDVTSVLTGTEALSIAPGVRPDVALIDLQLPDMSGLDVLRELCLQGVRCAIVTGFGSCGVAVDAMRLGAFDVVEKPLFGDAVTALVARAAASIRPLSTPELEPELHSVRRWTDMVTQVVPLIADPRTLKEWGRAIGVSEGALRNWCRTARIPARRSLMFARVLRAVVHHQQTRLQPENLLNIVDRRTIVKLLAQCGASHGCLPATPREFLTRQTLVLDTRAVREVAKCLGAD